MKSILNNQWATSVIDSWITNEASTASSCDALPENVIRIMVNILDRYTFGEYSQPHDPLLNDIKFLFLFENFTLENASKFRHNIFSSIESLIEENNLNESQTRAIGLLIFDILEGIGDYHN